MFVLEFERKNMQCPTCGNSIPFHQRSAPACKCGWVGTKKRELSGAVVFAAVILLSGTIGGWIYYQQNLHRFHPDERLANQYLAKGKDYLAKENWLNAVQQLQMSIQYSPNRADSHYQLFHAYKKLNDMGQASEEMRIAAELSPNDWKMQQVYGETLEQTDETQKALDQFLKVSKQFPHDYVSLEHAALCAERMNDNDRAVDLWYAALHRNVGATEGWTNLARIAFRENRPDDAIKVLKQGIGKNPTDAMLWYRLGTAYNDMGKKKDAVAALNKCASLQPAYTGYVGDLMAHITSDEKRPTYLLPLERNENGLIVEAVLNEKVRVKLLVDSGASSTVISTKAARQLGLDPNKLVPVQFKSVTGTATAQQAVLNTVRVGTAKGRNVMVIIYDNYGGDLDGLLGMTFLEQFKFTIDAHRNQLTLSPR